MEEDQTEVTPLLHYQNSNGSSSKVPSVDLERQNPNGITFYGSPDVPSIIVNPPHLHDQWHAQGPRSDTSSLATLATYKKMSDPRRTFCLFLTFDFLLTGLLWLIEVGTSSNVKGGFFQVLEDQVAKYTLHASLFDVTMLAFLRFLFLLICYGGFRIRHWWPVAVSTALSDAFLIFKIFAIFPGIGTQKVQTLNLPMTIVCILTDFILTWIEVWLIDFKVLPAEAKLAQRTAQAFLQQSYRSAPAIDETMGRGGQLYAGRPRSMMEAGMFYSPAGTPPPSEGGYTGVESMYYSMHGYHRSNVQMTPEEVKIIQLGQEGLDKLWGMYQNIEMWKPEKYMDNGDVVFTTETAEYGKSFKIESKIIGRSADVIFNEILLQPEDMPNWNKTVADVKMLRRVGEQTFISLEVSAPAALGLIASREFVTVRRIERRGNLYISAGISTDQCDDLVPKSNFVRGINGPTGFIVRPDPSDAHSSLFTWILNTDLKGNLSRSLVNRNLTRTLIDFVSAMKSRLRVV